MSTDRLQRAARFLVGLRQPGPRPASLPPDLAPKDEADAYALQAQVTALLNARPGAWKVAMSGPDAGTFAPIFATDVQPSGATVRSPVSAQLGIEPEVAFTLQRALPPNRQYSRQEVIDAIGSAHAAIEIVVSRFQRHESAAVLDRLADNLSNGGLIVGPPLERWQRLDLTVLPLKLTLTAPGAPPSLHTSRGGHPQGDPLTPMTWIVNALAERGQGMRAGEIVTTGSFAGLHYAAPGTRVRADFEGLGVVEVCG